MILKLVDYLHRTFGAGRDTTANILITLFTFSLGILITILFKLIEGIIERRKYRKLLKINLKGLIKEMLRQANAYDKFSKALVFESDSVPTFRTVSISCASIFNQIGYKNFYSAFFNGIENIRYKKRTPKQIAFNNLWSAIEFLKLFHESSFNEFEMFVKNEKEANELRNQCILKAYELANTLRNTFHNNPVPSNLDLYRNELEKIFIDYQRQTDTTNPKIVNNLFIHPIFELNARNMNLVLPIDYQSKLNTPIFNSILMECLIRYENQKNLVEATHLYFENLNENFQSHLQKLKSTYKILF